VKLVRFGEPGRERPGLIDAAGDIRDQSAHVRDLDKMTLVAEELARLATIGIDSLPSVAKGVRIGACVGDVGKVVCVGLNYTDHAKEANLPIPTEPVLFLKPTSAICGPFDDVLIPPGAEKVDWEVELGIVIGKVCRHVPKEQALRHVAGYCVANDVSERSYQMERGGQWDKGKAYDTFAPLGPWLVTTDEAGDAQALSLWLEVDGKRYQDGNTANMIFDVPTIVSYISQFMSLHPGDVIITGTPAGVGLGQKPNPVYLRAGQIMRLGISGLGEQRQRLVTR
jgi:ureidoglycolate lyase/2,4-diketo-3-deoxy-L-fuconate hydrolase